MLACLTYLTFKPVNNHGNCDTLFRSPTPHHAMVEFLWRLDSMIYGYDQGNLSSQMDPDVRKKQKS